MKNPWVPAWWSAAFPGMGHIMLGSYVKGFILFTWEFVINVTEVVLIVECEDEIDEKIEEILWTNHALGVSRVYR
ncbi:hypothetical protein [Bacillus alkalicola]|uniref:Uncharacterized protein n=2 Tax=Bacillaceae TaxID=186817 RepID=A0ABS6JXR9_9BACI|nr:hypothetical protein [Bacillus alkalicola]MBU9723381.1 hypothetical protein [Bacillus alkalicola]